MHAAEAATKKDGISPEAEKKIKENLIMLKIKVLIPAAKIAKKIDVDSIMKKLASLDCFTVKKGEKIDIKKQLAEHGTEIGLAIIPELINIAADVAEDLPELVAAYKGITPAEAAELDAIEEIKGLAKDAGILDFFASALKKKSEGLA